LEKLEAEVDIMSEGEFKNFSQTGSRFRNWRSIHHDLTKNAEYY
jgi:hypothetical protein